MPRLYLCPVIILLVEALLASVPAVNASWPVATLNVPHLVSAAIDGVTTCPTYRTDCGYAYFGTTTASVVKVSLSDFKIAGPLLDLAAIVPGLDPSSSITSAVVDHHSGYAYFTFDIWSYTNHNSYSYFDLHFNLHVIPALQAVVARINLATFRLEGTPLNLTDGVVPFKDFGDNSGVIDSASNYGYFAASNSSAEALVYKVRLSDFTLTATLSVPTGGFGCSVCLTFPVIDDYDNLYYSGQLGLVKISLSSFTRVGPKPYSVQPGSVQLVIDPAAGYLYFSGSTRLPSGGTRDLVARLRLSDFVVDNLILPSYAAATAAVIDPIHGYAYFGSSGVVAQVRLSDFTLVTEDAFCFSGGGGGGGDLALIEAEPGYAYFYTGGGPISPRIDKIDLSAPVPDWATRTGRPCSPNPTPSIWNILQNAWNFRLPIPYWPVPILQTAGLGGAASVASAGLAKYRNKRKGKRLNSRSNPQAPP